VNKNGIALSNAENGNGRNPIIGFDTWSTVNLNGLVRTDGNNMRVTY